MNTKLIEKIEKVSEQLADEMKYLYWEHIVGHAGAVFDKCIGKESRINPIPEEYFDAIVNGLINSFYDGCEPEFETEKQWNRWEKGVEYLKSCEWRLPDPNGRTYHERNSPYRDQTIPYLRPTIKFEVNE